MWLTLEFHFLLLESLHKGIQLCLYPIVRIDFCQFYETSFLALENAWNIYRVENHFATEKMFGIIFSLPIWNELNRFLLNTNSFLTAWVDLIAFMQFYCWAHGYVFFPTAGTFAVADQLTLLWVFVKYENKQHVFQFFTVSRWNKHTLHANST